MSVTKRGPGVWLARHQMMFKGERLFDESGVAATRQEAKALEAEFISQAQELRRKLKEGASIESIHQVQQPEKLSVDDVFKLWIRTVAPNWRSANTRRIAMHSFETYVLGTFEGEADKLDHHTVRSVIDELEHTGGVRGKGVGIKIRRDVHRQGKAAFDWAVAEGIVSDNPFVRVPRPKGERVKEIPAPPFEAVTATHRDLEQRGSWAANALLVMLESGLRREEVCALQWVDVGSDGEIRVRRAAKLDENQVLVVEETKSVRSDRTVTISSETAAKILQTKGGDSDQDYVFGPEGGGPRLPDVLTATIGKASKRAGYPGVSPHGLRRAYATAGAKAGVQGWQLQSALGHSSIVTSQRYVTAAQLDSGKSVNEAVLAEFGTTKKEDFIWEEVVAKFDDDLQHAWVTVFYGRVFERAGDPTTSQATLSRASHVLGKRISSVDMLAVYLQELNVLKQGSFENIAAEFFEILVQEDLVDVTTKLAEEAHFDRPNTPIKKRPVWSNPTTLAMYEAAVRDDATLKEFLEKLGVSNATAHRRRAEKLATENGLPVLRSASAAGARRVWLSKRMNDAVKESRTPQEVLRRCGLVDSPKNRRRVVAEYGKFTSPKNKKPEAESSSAQSKKLQAKAD